MKHLFLGVSVCALGAGSAMAGGVERSIPSVGLLFQPGQYTELTFSSVNPEVSGAGAGPFTGLKSGDMAGSYSTFSLGYKQALNDKLDLAITIDQPIGVSVNYPAANAPYPFAGSTASIKSTAVTALLRYKLPSNFSVYGGVKLEQVEGDVRIIAPLLSPAFTNYRMIGDRDQSMGYVVGAAWEKPEIAARVALTYASKIDHTLDTHETGLAPISLPGKMKVEVPASLTLDFQSGVAANTLVFGSIRWVDWTKFAIIPPVLNTSIADYSNDVVTMTLGVGHKFTDNWSGAVIMSYEKHNGDPVGNLGPTDGMRSVALAASYQMDHVKITGGVSYIEIGDATTRSIGSKFTGGKGVGVGLRIGYAF